jgi:hypothetical protein
VWTNPYFLLPAGALCGAGVAGLVAGLGQVGDATALVLIAGTVLGTLSASGLHWVLARGPLCAAGEDAKALAEVDHAYQQGYEIVYRRGRPSGRCEKWLFYVRRQGRTCGYLDLDWMGAKHWIYVENVYVDDRHGSRGLAMALLLCAACTTGCRVLTTSSRTRQGVQFFAKARGVLKKYGIDMPDKHP